MTAVFRKVGQIALCFVYSAIAILVFAGIQIGAGFMMAYAGLNLEINDGAFTVVYSVIVITVGYIIIKVGGLAGEDGLVHTRKLGNESLCSVFIAFGMLGLVTLFIVLIGYLADANVGNTQEELERYSESVDRFANVEIQFVPPIDNVFCLIGSAFLVPLAEELTFRGFVMGFFRKAVNPVWAMILSSALFAVLHSTPIQMIYAFLCGVMLGMIYHLTGSLWGSYIVHMVFNLFGGAIATFFQSGIIPVPDGFIDNFSYVTALAEILMIGPAVGALMFLINMHKKKAVNEQA